VFTDSFSPPAELSALVLRIQSGDPVAQGQLYEKLSRGLLLLLRRRADRQDVQDLLHETWIAVMQALETGQLREPSSVAAFALTIARRKAAQQSENSNRTRDKAVDLRVLEAQSDDEIIRKQQVQIMAAMVHKLRPLDREILKRFYLKAQTKEQICAELNLTETQFRVRKSRAKTVVQEAGRKTLARKAASGGSSRG
jgi:RNA polymerase sigma-70 factor (ECF subfamily)